VTRVLVTSRSFGKGTKDLVAAATVKGLELTFGPSHHSLSELRLDLSLAEAWIAGTGPVTAEHMDAAPGLRVIARYGVGVDAVDLAAAARRGIIVTNTPGANSGAVADLALALILGSLRHISWGDREVRAGRWNVLPGRELGSLVVGIVGFGRIGQGVAERISGFGSRMLAVDPYVSVEFFDRLGVEQTDLDTLFAQSDVVTLHAPGGEMVANRRRLGMMKPGSVVVNTARADLVDEVALAEALREGLVGSFASDVLSGDTQGSTSPLLAPDLAAQVTLTPHLGAQTLQAVDHMGQMALDNVVSVLAGTIPPNPVTITS
jgi:D-3-phosphoglycerate dehydrogenase